jgi:hypothetical protein
LEHREELRPNEEGIATKQGALVDYLVCRLCEELRPDEEGIATKSSKTTHRK